MKSEEKDRLLEAINLVEKNGGFVFIAPGNQSTSQVHMEKIHPHLIVGLLEEVKTSIIERIRNHQQEKDD